MKAICKRAFTAAGKSYKPGDEVECSAGQFKKWAWHNYVWTPEEAAEAEKKKAGEGNPEDMPEKETEDAADEGGSKSGDESPEKISDAESGDVSETSGPEESSPENETEKTE